MALNDLRTRLSAKTKNYTMQESVQSSAKIDAGVACDIVNHIFDYAGICLKEDRSKVKINLFTKAFIGGILNDKVKDGLNDFVRNMNDADINMLLNEIQRDLNKRRK